MTFKSPWWLKGAHLQTLWSALLRRKPSLNLIWERLELNDGDFLDLVWLCNIIDRMNGSILDRMQDKTPIVLLLHGLNGSIDSPYTTGMLKAIEDQGFRGVLMHFRGCSGEPNRLPRAYHSGETGDLQTVVNELKKRYPHAPLSVIGYSLGGNVLLKWLGETGSQNVLQAAVAVSTPFELQKTADYLNVGFSRIYQWWLVRGLKQAHQRKFKKNALKKQFKEFAKFSEIEVARIKNFWEFDEKITAPLHGFNSAKEYYQLASSRQYLPKIRIPTLILQAKNDPFVPSTALPEIQEISSSTCLEVFEDGGHVGFVAGKIFWPEYWLEKRIIDFLQSFNNN